MISDWDKFVTSGQIPVQIDVSYDVFSGIDIVGGPALAMDSGLKKETGNEMMPSLIM